MLMKLTCFESAWTAARPGAEASLDAGPLRLFAGGSELACAHGALGGVVHLMRLQVVADQLPYDLRRRQILAGAQFFKRGFLVGVDQERQPSCLGFHD